MGWSLCGTDDLGRPIGYGVEAECDFPGCIAKIDRGLSYCCGKMHGGDGGCGRYFCGDHIDNHNCEYKEEEEEEEEEC